MSELPKSLVSIMRDEKILKVGVGIGEDVLKLKRHRGLICKGMADIQAMGMKSLGLAAKAPKVGLKALAQSFVGIELIKPKRIAVSNWEDFPLTLQQIEYAAMDAWAGLRVYQEITGKRQLINKPPYQDVHVETIPSRSPVVRYVLLLALVVLLYYIFL
ncbi:hypothetical protein OS493_032772 [Desmophyllum pertusum]|uniref:3'-5' exonuclease domain-containing protein n=1 Tax=Desmophyllum pertusum TaxID=174260 RepID=A0A9X0D133_9CNID|nr:hypothetical protein OS493_032772 [Desmophyllum pertusum]